MPKNNYKEPQKTKFGFYKLKISRQDRKVGDIFVMSINPGEYIWGRVIRDKDVDVAGFGWTEGMYLVYI